MDQNQKHIARNYIYNTCYQILVLVAPLVTTPYISRVLGASGIGIYNYAQSIATYFIYVGAVGTTIYGQREIAYAQNDQKKRSEIFWEIATIKFVAVTFCAVIYFLFFCKGGEYSSVYRILILEVFASMFDISWFFMGMENFKVTVIRNTIIKLIGIILIFTFVKSSDDVIVYTLCLTLPIFIGNISLWFSLPRYLTKVRIHTQGVIRNIRPALILFLPQLAIEVYAVLDKTMLGALASDIREVGYYSQASRIIKILLALVTSLGTVMLPAMSSAYAHGQKDVITTSIKKSFRFVYMLGFALMFGGCSIASNFVPIFFGAGYDRVIILIVMISPIIVIIATSNVIGKQYLLPTSQEKYYTISVVTGAMMNIVLNVILIARFDAVGASIATVFAELTVTSIQAFVVRKQLNISKCLLPAIKYFICGSIMCAAVYLLGAALGEGVKVLIIQIFAGVIVYALELLLTRDSMFFEGINIILKK